MMSKYHEAFKNISEALEYSNYGDEYLIAIDLHTLRELIDERPILINTIKEISEMLENLTLEQKKSLGATVFTIQGLIIETLER